MNTTTNDYSPNHYSSIWTIFIHFQSLLTMISIPGLTFEYPLSVRKDVPPELFLRPLVTARRSPGPGWPSSCGALVSAGPHWSPTTTPTTRRLFEGPRAPGEGSGSWCGKGKSLRKNHNCSSWAWKKPASNWAAPHCRVLERMETDVETDHGNHME